jgi:hypothetical protein
VRFGSDATIDTSTATQISSENGRTHNRNAAGTGNGSHGSSSNASSAGGRGDAPRRCSPATTTTAAATTSATGSEIGRTAIRAPLAPANPRVPSDSHAATAVIRNAPSGARTVMRRVGSVSRCLHVHGACGALALRARTRRRHDDTTQILVSHVDRRCPFAAPRFAR